MVQGISDLLLKAQVDHAVCLVQNQDLAPASEGASPMWARYSLFQKIIEPQNSFCNVPQQQ